MAGPTRGAARGARWRRTSRGWYVPADVDASPVEQRILEQSVRLPAVGALTGWAALRWRGAHYFTGLGHGVELPVPFALGCADVGHDAAVRVSRERFWPHEIEVVDGIPCAVAVRALFDQMRWEAGLRAAVVAVDMTVAAGILTVADLREYLSLRNGWTGVPRAREAAALASADSRSPQESRMRLVWVLDAHLPVPRCNKPVFDLAGRLLGYPDLFDPVAGLVGEYDGQDHLLMDRRQGDVEREQRFRDHGLEYFCLVRGDLADRARVVQRMLGARRRARFLPEDRRPWTLTPPAWWQPPIVRG